MDWCAPGRVAGFGPPVWPATPGAFRVKGCVRCGGARTQRVGPVRHTTPLRAASAGAASTRQRTLATTNRGHSATRQVVPAAAGGAARDRITQDDYPGASRVTTDLDGSVPWKWLAGCLTCGEPHEYRPECCECGRPNGSGRMTWAADDGHAYQRRLSQSVHELRSEYMKDAGS